MILVDGDVLSDGCDGNSAEGSWISLESSESKADFGFCCDGIRKDRDGNLWVRGRNAGVFVLPPGHMNFAGPMCRLPVRWSAYLIDSSGRILLPSPAGLLIREGKHWQKSPHFRFAEPCIRFSRTGGTRCGIGLAGRGLVQWRGYREWKAIRPPVASRAISCMKSCHRPTNTVGRHRGRAAARAAWTSWNRVEEG